MKKKIAIAVMIAGMGLAGLNQAYAGWGARGGGQNWNCPQYPAQAVMGYNQIDPAVQEKLDNFFTSTQDLRRQMIVKRAEQRAILRGDNPDPAMAGKLAGELFDLRAQMRAKAEEAGVAEYLGPRGFGQGGPDKGRHGGRKNNTGFGPGYGQGRF